MSPQSLLPLQGRRHLYLLNTPARDPREETADPGLVEGTMRSNFSLPTYSTYRRGRHFLNSFLQGKIVPTPRLCSLGDHLQRILIFHTSLFVQERLPHRGPASDWLGAVGKVTPPIGDKSSARASSRNTYSFIIERAEQTLLPQGNGTNIGARLFT